VRTSQVAAELGNYAKTNSPLMDSHEQTRAIELGRVLARTCRSRLLLDNGQNDADDAELFGEAMSRPNTRFVATNLWSSSRYS
jgi:hypothetical protein